MPSKPRLDEVIPGPAGGVEVEWSGKTPSVRVAAGAEPLAAVGPTGRWADGRWPMGRVPRIPPPGHRPTSHRPCGDSGPGPSSAGG